jgi:hypothetical protein
MPPPQQLAWINRHALLERWSTSLADDWPRWPLRFAEVVEVEVD